MRDAELRSQRHEAGLWRAVKEAEYSQLTLSAQQLGKQLEREMARAAGLEERLAAAGAEKVRQHSLWAPLVQGPAWRVGRCACWARAATGRGC